MSPPELDARQRAAVEILARCTDPDRVMRALIAAWDADWELLLARVHELLPTADLEPIRRELRARYEEWR